jgi:hypothetical protein
MYRSRLCCQYERLESRNLLTPSETYKYTFIYIYVNIYPYTHVQITRMLSVGAVREQELIDTIRTIYIQTYEYTFIYIDVNIYPYTHVHYAHVISRSG